MTFTKITDVQNSVRKFHSVEILRDNNLNLCFKEDISLEGGYVNHEEWRVSCSNKDISTLSDECTVPSWLIEIANNLPEPEKPDDPTASFLQETIGSVMITMGSSNILVTPVSYKWQALEIISLNKHEPIHVEYNSVGESWDSDEALDDRVRGILDGVGNNLVDG